MIGWLSSSRSGSPAGSFGRGIRRRCPVVVLASIERRVHEADAPPGERHAEQSPLQPKGRDVAEGLSSFARQRRHGKGGGEPGSWFARCVVPPPTQAGPAY